MTEATAFSNLSASLLFPMWRKSKTPERIAEVGFTLFFPAYFGALPWTGSKTAYFFPMFAEGAIPKPPTNPEQRSEIISP